MAKKRPKPEPKPHGGPRPNSGRPRAFPGIECVDRTTRLPRSLWAVLDEYAAERGIALGRALAELLAKHPATRDVVRELLRGDE
jgi:hypothetical protein